MDEECWEALGAVRQAMEEFVPPNWIGPADETTTIAAEAEALASAIRRLASFVPLDVVLVSLSDDTHRL